MSHHTDIDELVELPLVSREGFFDVSALQNSGGTQFRHLTWMRGGNGRGVDVRIGYRRSHDFDPDDLPGQDSAFIRHDRRHLIGVVADGVGQSFFGNLAAEHVATWLRDELWRERMDPPDEETLGLGLREQGKLLASKVAAYSLDSTPDWLRPTLEQTREAAGSQAVFAAFIWDAFRDEISLYQVGDVAALVLLENAEWIQIQSRDTKGRWSSTGKSRSELTCNTWRHARGILLKSDGVDEEWDPKFKKQEIDADVFGRIAAKCADKDDVSFVSAWIPKLDRRTNWGYVGLGIGMLSFVLLGRAFGKRKKPETEIQDPVAEGPGVKPETTSDETQSLDQTNLQAVKTNSAPTKDAASAIYSDISQEHVTHRCSLGADKSL